VVCADSLDGFPRWTGAGELFVWLVPLVSVWGGEAGINSVGLWWLDGVECGFGCSFIPLRHAIAGGLQSDC
jgi:hypothetical protein